MKQPLLLLAFLFLMASCGDQTKQPAAEAGSTATMYYGGDIITMEGDQPQYVESVVVKDGRILFAGAKDEAMKAAGRGHKMIDLQGKTLLPGFIDAHGHLMNAGFQALSANLLPPPDGEGKDIEALIGITRKWVEANPKFIEKAGWIIGFGFDDAQLAEKRYPTADDLDKISTDKPVLLIHQSCHLCSMNHKALELAGYTDGVKDPKGGLIRREKGSQRPNGVLEEMAMFIPIFALFGKATDEDNQSLILAGIKAYTRYGFTTAQEGRASDAACQTYRLMAEAKKLPIDVVAYPDIQAYGEWMKKDGNPQKTYTNRFRVGGVKLSLDGSPQGKTAWLTEPYKVPPPGQPKTYKGYPAIPEESEAEGYVATAFANNWQILAHCNGDAAADLYIRSVRKAADQHGNNDRRSVMIHAQTVREDQLDSMKALGIIPSFFSMHTFYWGDWHANETLGQPRANRISPTGSALKRNMIFTEHHDAPVANPDAIRILDNTVNRTSRSGQVIGPDQRITTYQALKSITDWAAYQYFEEELKGTIKAGKLADFVILDKNPVKIDPKELGKLQVVETIKEGNTVYRKP
jgi:predicted amidohydrolase YtcJ